MSRSRITSIKRAAIVEMYNTPNPDGSRNAVKLVARQFGVTPSMVTAILREAGVWVGDTAQEESALRRRERPHKQPEARPQAAKQPSRNGRRTRQQRQPSQTAAPQAALAQAKRVQRRVDRGEPPLCRCGCGQAVTWNAHKGRWRAYVSGHYPQPQYPYQDRRWLHDQVVVQRKSAATIAAECGVTAYTIRQWARRYKLQPAALPEKKSRRSWTPELRAEVVTLYTTPNADGSWNTVKGLARRYKTDPTWIRHILKQAGVPRRSAT